MATQLQRINNNLESCKRMIQYCNVLELNGNKFELMTNLNVLFRSLAEGNFVGAEVSQLQQRSQLWIQLDQMKTSLLLKYKKKTVIDSCRQALEKVTN